MENFSSLSADANAFGDQVNSGLGQEQMEIMWQMGVASLASNNNQLVIPNFMAVQLSEKNVIDLKTRFSAHFGNADTTAFFDHGAQVFRISLAANPTNIGSGATAYLTTPSPADSTQSLFSTSSSAQASFHPRAGTPDRQSAPAKQLRLPGKKSKVPRPANAFILYRKKHHPILKTTQPDLKNNEISVILGRQWRQESEEVKSQFKAMADKLKAQHLAENPGYQYNPRKPSEKKRRMTARKLARLASESDANSNSDLEMMDVADNGGVMHTDHMVVDNLEHKFNEAAAFPQPTSAADILGAERSSYPTHLKHHRDDDMSLMMPTGHSQVEHDYMIKMSDYQITVPFEHRPTRRLVTTTRSSHTANANAFMDSLVDWDAIQEDADIIRASTEEDIAEAVGAEQGDSVVAFDTEDEAVKFQQELERVLWMLA